MKIRMAQLVVTKHIKKNKTKIVSVLDQAGQDEWVVFPEGILSGYYPEDKDFVKELNSDLIKGYIQEIKQKVNEKKCHTIFGSAIYENGGWYNSSIYLDYKSEEAVYHKNNLATLDRNHFLQGKEIPIYQAGGIKFGIQMCREVVFPEQWKLLKRKGAQIVFHINNSIKISDKVRSNLLVARAFENQYFVCSVNNAAKPQALPSYLISPFGEILFESTVREEQVVIKKIDLKQVQNYYLNQERTDLVRLEYK